MREGEVVGVVITVGIGKSPAAAWSTHRLREPCLPSSDRAALQLPLPAATAAQCGPSHSPALSQAQGRPLAQGGAEGGETGGWEGRGVGEVSQGGGWEGRGSGAAAAREAGRGWGWRCETDAPRQCGAR